MSLIGWGSRFHCPDRHYLYPVNVAHDWANAKSKPIANSAATKKEVKNVIARE